MAKRTQTISFEKYAKYDKIYRAVETSGFDVQSPYADIDRKRQLLTENEFPFEDNPLGISIRFAAIYLASREMWRGIQRGEIKVDAKLKEDLKR